MGLGFAVCDGVAAWFCAFRVVGASAKQRYRVSAANWGGIKFIFGRNSGVTESDQHRKTYLLAHRLILFFDLFARA